MAAFNQGGGRPKVGSASGACSAPISGSDEGIYSLDGFYVFCSFYIFDSAVSLLWGM